MAHLVKAFATKLIGEFDLWLPHNEREPTPTKPSDFYTLWHIYTQTPTHT